MLNKELLLAASSPQLKGGIQLTVGAWGDRNYGYSSSAPAGALDRIPCYYAYSGTNLIRVTGIVHGIVDGRDTGVVNILFKNLDRISIQKIKLTVLEKGLTVDLSEKVTSSIGTTYYVYENKLVGLFTESDVGKTFNIVLDPPPDGYA